MTPQALGLTPELLWKQTETQLSFGPVSAGQHRWFERSLDEAGLERAVRYYYQVAAGVEPSSERVRVDVGDSSGTVIAAETTDEHELMLPWSVTNSDGVTCTSWNPRLSQAVGAYVSGHVGDVLRGDRLADVIASSHILQHYYEWYAIAARERFERDLQPLAHEYSLTGASFQHPKDGPEEARLMFAGAAGPKNLQLRLNLPIRNGRLDGLASALKDGRRLLALARAFPPISAKLDVPGTTVSIFIPVFDKSGFQDAAKDDLTSCNAPDLAALVAARHGILVDVRQLHDDGLFWRSYRWIILPNGSAVLFSGFNAGPLALELPATVPQPDPRLHTLAALFAADGSVVTARSCARYPPGESATPTSAP